MTNQEFEILLKGYLLQQLTAAELDRFSAAAALPAYEAIIKASLDRDLLEKNFSNLTTHEQAAQSLEVLRERLVKEKSVRGRVAWMQRSWLRYAAAIVLIMGAVAYYLIKDKKENAVVSDLQNKGDVAPGRNGALLTLADGTRMLLDSVKDGVLVVQAGVNVEMKNGQLAYHETGKTSGEMTYNSVSTPRGRQFALTLPDGTKVWLNSGSSMRYPTRFAGNERRVDITGEVYFEVAKDKNKPFLVNSRDLQVQVLGTHFNVNAYEDEGRALITLMEGSIKVADLQTQRTVIIEPGQQVQLSTNGNNRLQVNHEVDTEQVLSWKNGLFQFNNLSLPAIMRQVSRWYDVDVIFEQPPGDELFGGGISRELPLSQVLKLLEENGWQFSVEGKKVFVKPRP